MKDLQPYQVQLGPIYMARRKPCKRKTPYAFLKLKRPIVLCNELRARVGGITVSARVKTISHQVRTDLSSFSLNLKMNPI